MITEEQPVLPTFGCYSGGTMQTFSQFETTLFSDRVRFKGKRTGFEMSIPISTIFESNYQSLKQAMGNKLYHTILILLSFLGVFLSSMISATSALILFLFIVFILTIFLSLGEIQLVTDNGIIILVGSKRSLNRFSKLLETSLNENFCN
ncbi:MAG: hypothetical protein ACXAC2_05400 [Candidatus Kariarchaeaceae archaeon]|jgi:hypothetical protein